MGRLLPAMVLVLALVAAAPATAAGTRQQIIRDCFDDGKLDGSYTPSQIRDARSNLPADVDQYSDCRDVLSRALGGSGSRRVGGGGTSATSATGAGTGAPAAAGAADAGGTALTPPSAVERQALDTAARSGDGEPVQVGGAAIVPGASGFAAGTARHALPVPLLVVLIGLALAAAAAAVPAIRRRVRPRRGP